MGIRETLQETLVRANNERINQHGVVQNLEGRLVELKMELQRAQTQKAGADATNQTVTNKYRELLDYCNGLNDQSARNAIAAPKQQAAARNAAAAAENLRQWQRRLTELETQRAAAQANLRDAWKDPYYFCIYRVLSLIRTKVLRGSGQQPPRSTVFSLRQQAQIRRCSVRVISRIPDGV
jgi:hypothetical protein